MDAIEGQKSIFVCAGHGCWGILMRPASGEAMASLIVTGKSTIIDIIKLTKVQKMFEES